MLSSNNLQEKLMPNRINYSTSTNSNNTLINGGLNDLLEDRIKLISSIITGASNFSIQYNFQVIAITLLVMTASICTTDDNSCQNNIQEIWVQTTANSVVFIGCIIGQLSMGYFGDKLGRNYALLATFFIGIVGALCSSIFVMGSAEDIYGNIVIFRFVLGIGCGGVYPLTAAKAAEDAARHLVDKNNDDIDILAASKAFFWQVPGILTPWIIGYMLTFSSISVNTKWRLLLGIGAIPLFFVFLLTCWEIYLRNQIIKPKTSNKVGMESIDSVQEALFIKNRRNTLLSDIKYKKLLFFVGSCSCIFDMAFFGVALFAALIIFAMRDQDDDHDDISSNASIRYAAIRQLIALSCGIPSVILTIYSVKYLGTKTTQKYGFMAQALMFFILAGCFDPLSADNVFTVYCFLVFFLFCGSYVTTYCIPAETFPYEIRTTYSGIAAAFGKLGAVIGVILVIFYIL